MEKIDNSANNLWGQVVSKLRTTSHTILYTACGDIRQVVLNQNELVLFVQDEYLYNILIKPSNFGVLVEMLAKVNRNASLKIEKKQSAQKNSEQDILLLQKKFGKILVVK